MLLTTAIGLFLGIWSLILLIDHYLRIRNTEAYSKLVDRFGLIISPFHVRLYTGNRFQRLYDRWSCLKWPKIKHFLDIWFLVGVVVSLLSSVFIIYLLGATLYGQINKGAHFVYILSSQQEHKQTVVNNNINVSDDIVHDPSSVGQQQTLETFLNADQAGIVPIIPGVNMPWSHAPLLFVILVVAGVLHELGHALAAATQRVTVNGFGVFLLGIYPGAFTELDHETLRSAGFAKRLKIFCGGIWHNLATAVLALGVIVALPTLLSLGYATGRGVVVTSVDSASGLGQTGGLQSGHVVYDVNDCAVNDEESWTACLHAAVHRNDGFCVPRFKTRAPSAATRPFTRVDADGELQCCAPNSSASHLCFYFKVSPSTVVQQSSNYSIAYSCMPARYVTDHYPCNHSQPCRAPQTVCVYPAVFNETRLFRFRIDGGGGGGGARQQPVLFIGHPRAVYEHVRVNSYVPRRYIDEHFSAPTWLPAFLDLFFRYLFTLSLAFALLNAAPCYSLDGQYIWAEIIMAQCHCSKRSSSHGEPFKTPTEQRSDASACCLAIVFYKLLMFLGTTALVAVVFLGLISFFWPFITSY